MYILHSLYKFSVYKLSFGCTKRDSKCKFSYKGTYYWPRLLCLPLPLPLPLPPLPLPLPLPPMSTVPGPRPIFSLELVLVLVLPALALLLVPVAWLTASGVVWLVPGLVTVASSWGWAEGGAFVSCPTSISKSISACISSADISVN